VDAEPRRLPLAGPEQGDLEVADSKDADPKAYWSEMFLSFQGEGMLVGVRQLFIRLAGCNIRCPWCDTPDALVAKEVATLEVEEAPGHPEFRKIPNPVPVSSVVQEAARIVRAHGPVEWVSLTGGEPTMWRKALAALCPRLKDLGLKVFLETNSLYPATMRAIAPWTDFVSADIKVPFADYPEAKRETYLEFLRAAAPCAGKQVKVVVSEEYPDADVIEAARMVASVDRRIPLILQPVTPVGGVGRPPSPRKLLSLQREALTFLDEVRIIPQTHKLVGAL
jgi:7-carboxy-7-deazaguanine synthase